MDKLDSSEFWANNFKTLFSFFDKSGYLIAMNYGANIFQVRDILGTKEISH